MYRRGRATREQKASRTPTRIARTRYAVKSFDTPRTYWGSGDGIGWPGGRASAQDVLLEPAPPHEHRERAEGPPLQRIEEVAQPARGADSRQLSGDDRRQPGRPGRRRAAGGQRAAGGDDVPAVEVVRRPRHEVSDVQLGDEV